MELQPQPHLYDRGNQEAAWQAVVKVSGMDLANQASLRPQGPKPL